MNVRPLFLLTIAAVILLSGWRGTASALTANSWQTTVADYEQILARAKEQNKPFLLYFHVNWCGYCKQFSSALLQNSAVEQTISSYFRVKINPENGEKENLLAMQYGVGGYPYFLIIRPSGERIRIHPFRQGGSIWSAEEFITRLKAVLEPKD